MNKESMEGNKDYRIFLLIRVPSLLVAPPS